MSSQPRDANVTDNIIYAHQATISSHLRHINCSTLLTSCQKYKPVKSANLAAHYDTGLAGGLARLTLQSTSAEEFSSSELSSEMSVSSSQSPDSWISSFCSLMGHEYFAEVSEEFVEDDFNLTGLQSQVPMYKDALEMILDVEPSETGSSGLTEEEEEDDDDDGILGDDSKPLYDRRDSAGRRHRLSSDTAVIESSAELLYGLIHARYITSRPGIQQMMEKYEHAHFGYCPRVHCNGCKVLPVGRTDTPGQDTVKLFCPSCLDIYTPPNSRFQSVDGAFFGTTFGCLFLMTFTDLEISPMSPAASRSQLSPASVAQSTLSPSHTASTLDSKSTVTERGLNGSTTTLQNSSLIPPQPASINGFGTHNLAPGLGKPHIYQPRIYGFRVSERAKSGPRMKWLRSRPQDINELNEVFRWHEEYGGDADGDPDVVESQDGEISDDEEQLAIDDGRGAALGGGDGAGDVDMLGAGSQQVPAGKNAKKGRRRDEEEIVGEGEIG